MGDAVFVLFDRDYHLGLGALVNSLVSSGFCGTVYAGYRGDLPPWAVPNREEAGIQQFDVGAACAVRFVRVGYEGHLANYKAHFMLTLLGSHAAGAERAFWFDADLVIKAPWRFFQDWVSCGIAICRDIGEPYMSENHPLRKYWRDMAGELNLRCRPVLGYFNSGFLGLSAEHVGFLETWRSLIRLMESSGHSLASNKSGERPDPMTFRDQDMLNAALMASDIPIAPVENTSMDFAHGGYIMSHAIWRAKPWRRHYVLDALLGYPPDQPNKQFWRHVREPIAVMSERRRRVAAMSLAAAALIGRFYGRR
jgi:hypothetical protein